MRILVISDLPQFVTGGAEMQASRLIEAWLDRGHEVICCGRRMGASNVSIGRHRIRVHRIRVLQWFGRPGRAISYFLSLSTLLLRHRSWPDVIYTRFLNEAAVTVSLLKWMRLLRTVLIPTPANAGINGDDKVISALPFKRQLVRLLETQCDAINLIAPLMADDLQDLGFSGANFCFIPNGIDIPSYVAREHSGPLRLVFVGRLAPQKGLDILLSALGRINIVKSGGLQFEVIGDGPERRNLEMQTSELRLSGNVSFSGEKGQDEVQKALRASDIFVLPSRYEGLSNAALEALSVGLPILLSRCGGLDTYLDEASGWLVTPEEVEVLAETLARILRTPRADLLRMGQNAHGIASRNFAMAEVAERYLKLFESLRYRRQDTPQGNRPAA